MYDIYNKDKFTLKQLSRSTTAMAKQIPRTDPIPANEEGLKMTDNLKAAEQYSKIRFQTRSAFIDLSRQKSRTVAKKKKPEDGKSIRALIEQILSEN